MNRLDYAVTGGTVVVSTPGSLREQPKMIFYDVADLTIDIFTGEELVTRISKTIEPDSWNEKRHLIYFRNGTLITVNRDRAHKQISRLLNRIRQNVPGLRALKKLRSTLSGKVDKLIVKLGDDDYWTREKATKKLSALGRQAVPSLKKRLKAGIKDPEIVARIRIVLGKLDPIAIGKGTEVGRIAAVDDDMALAFISAGANNGVKLGMEFFVYRKKKYVGIFTVRKIFPWASAGDMRSSSLKIMKGDRVVTDVPLEPVD